jgi:hypothetical protein
VLLAGDAASSGAAAALPVLAGPRFSWCDSQRVLPGLPADATSTQLLAALRDVAQRQRRTDVLLLSAGRHDAARDGATFEPAVSLGQYQQNLVQLVEAARGVSSLVLWLNTPALVPEEGEQQHGGAAATPIARVWCETDLHLYQATARDVMWRSGVEVSLAVRIRSRLPCLLVAGRRYLCRLRDWHHSLSPKVNRVCLLLHSFRPCAMLCR